MEYTPMEQEILNIMKRTDFKNISKGEILSYASKLGEMRPEVAKEVLAQYPEFVGLMKSALTEYKGMLDSIISSDDASIKEYYAIASKEMDNAAGSRKQYFDFVKLVQADYSKVLDNPNLSSETILEILNREKELLEMSNQKDTEIRDQEKEVEDKANKKDSEKREFNWRLVGGASLALVTVIGFSAAVLGGTFDLKLPKK